MYPKLANNHTLIFAFGVFLNFGAEARRAM